MDKLLFRSVRRIRVSQETHADESERLDLAQIYEQNAEFLYRSLYRMGIPEADLPDVMQEVLLVIHRRLDSYDRSCRLTTWLFGICLRVAATARRARRRRREDFLDASVHRPELVESIDPERVALARDARRQLDRALDGLSPEKRAVLVMFELEGVSCGEIAELLGVPKGTVFSRLSLAREAFLQALERAKKHQEHPRLVGGQP